VYSDLGYNYTASHFNDFFYYDYVVYYSKLLILIVLLNYIYILIIY